MGAVLGYMIHRVTKIGDTTIKILGRCQWCDGYLQSIKKKGKWPEIKCNNPHCITNRKSPFKHIVKSSKNGHFLMHGLYTGGR
jgi:hypothetical protein